MRKSRGLVFSFFRVALSSDFFYLNETGPLLPVLNIVLPALSTCRVLSLCDSSLKIGRHPVLMTATAFNFGMVPYSYMDGAKIKLPRLFRMSPFVRASGVYWRGNKDCSWGFCAYIRNWALCWYLETKQAPIKFHGMMGIFQRVRVDAHRIAFNWGQTKGENNECYSIPSPCYYFHLQLCVYFLDAQTLRCFALSGHFIWRCQSLVLVRDRIHSSLMGFNRNKYAICQWFNGSCCGKRTMLLWVLGTVEAISCGSLQDIVSNLFFR